jgi:uncharacterized membrane protein YphA (DoxX/SURF4 family)
MNTASLIRSSRWPEALAILARWGLGLLFIYMGLTKALQPIDFLKLVRQYDVVDTPFFLNAIAILLPWFEVWCGLLLLAGIAVRGSALVIAVMLVVFTLLVLQRAWAIHTAQAIPFCAVKFNCGCGGGDVWICRKLTENSLLTLLALWLAIAGRGQGCCARYRLFRAC